MYGYLYRFIMRLAHRFNWHYAPPCYPDGDTMLWCHWCGFRAVIHRSNYPSAIEYEAAKSAADERREGEQES